MNVSRAASLIDPREFERLVAEQMGLTVDFQWRVLELAHGWAAIELDYHPSMVRPGGTVSGPSLFALTDLALFAAVMATVGLQPMVVTTEVTIHFLRRPPPRTMRATAEVLKAGKTIEHGDVRIYTEGEDAPVCHATGSYAIPGPSSRTLVGSAHG